MPTIRLGLCCAFRDQTIRFRTTTAAAISRLPQAERLARLSQLCQENADALYQALDYCAEAGIGCFRVLSQILPLRTHPEYGYAVEDLPEARAIVDRFLACGQRAKEAGVRTCFHPDQFVVLNSLRDDVVAASVRELESQAEVAAWINADVINIHGGGAQGNKPAALDRFARALSRISEGVRSRLTVENDDTVFTPVDLLPMCRTEGIPLVYDVHHHRCLPDGLSVEEATTAALATWDREPLFHVSSPVNGWNGPQPRRHHDFIQPDDVPAAWRVLDQPLTIEVEARAKEAAVLRLKSELGLDDQAPRHPRTRARHAQSTTPRNDAE